MPDIFTHVLFGISVALLVRRDDNIPEQTLIILGAILVDIERPITWLIESTELEWIAFGPAFHSILGAVVLSYFVAAFFVVDGTNFKNRVILIFIGCISHLLLDLVMYPWVEIGLYLLYPLKIPFSFDLFWPDFWWYPIFGILILLITFSIRLLINHRRFGATWTILAATKLFDDDL